MSQLHCDYDLITIGAGSGGVAASRRAASFGAKVAIIERDRVGGTCVIRGCVPKKLFMYAAQFAEAFDDSTGYGWQHGAAQFDLPALVKAKNAETHRLEGVYHQMLEQAGVDLIEGDARIISPHAIEVAGQRLTAARIVVATGSSPIRNAIPGLEVGLTSNELLDLDRLPEKLIVVGSGYIAVEFASFFRRYGSQVEMLIRSELPLRGFDLDLRKSITQEFTKQGIVLHTNTQATQVTSSGKEFSVLSKQGVIVNGDALLNATGRRPNTDGLGLDALGVDVDRHGAIVVDGFSQTNIPGIYAIGDVTNRYNLTPVAIAEGRAFADREFGDLDLAINYAVLPTAVFTLPPIATVGLSEEQARASGADIQIYQSEFRPMKHTLSGRNERTFMKLVVDAQSDRVLGAQMMGADAPEIIQGLAVALTCNVTKSQFDRTMALHPTSAEEFVLMRQARPESKKSL